MKPTPAALRGLPPPLVLALVALAAAAVYANALANGYALDDDYIIRENPLVHGLGNLRALATAPWWPGSDEMYRPLTLLSFAVEWELFGERPAAFHATSVGLHAAASALVSGLVLRLGGGRGAALAAGLVFAVHPVHVEAVANLVGRAEVLATLGVLAACHLYLAPRLREPVRVAGVAALYLLALGAKESAVALPALLLAVDAVRARGEGAGAGRLLRRNAPLLGALALSLAGYLALRQHLLGWVQTGAAPYLRDLSAADRLAVAAGLWPEYLRLLFFPATLSAEWGPDALRPAAWSQPAAWLGVAAVAALAAAARASWRGSRWVAAAVLWFAFAIFPVSQLPFAVGVLLAERTLYLPSVALAFLFPPAAALLAREPRRLRLAGGALALVLVLLAARTWTRTPTWASTNAVFAAMMEDHPRLWLVEWRAGELLARSGRPLEALPWYRSALEKVEGNHVGLAVQYGSLLLDLRRVEEAEAVLRRAAAANPHTPLPGAQLAAVLVEQRRYREALAVLDRAAAIRTRGPPPPLLGHLRPLAYDGMGMTDRALEAREAALREQGAEAGAPAWFHYARLLALAGRREEAEAAAEAARTRFAPRYRERVRLDPLPPADDPLILGWGRLAEEGGGPP